MIESAPRPRFCCTASNTAEGREDDRRALGGRQISSRVSRWLLPSYIVQSGGAAEAFIMPYQYTELGDLGGGCRFVGKSCFLGALSQPCPAFPTSVALLWQGQEAAAESLFVK